MPKHPTLPPVPCPEPQPRLTADDCAALQAIATGLPDVQWAGSDDGQRGCCRAGATRALLALAADDWTKLRHGRRGRRRYEAPGLTTGLPSLDRPTF